MTETDYNVSNSISRQRVAFMLRNNRHKMMMCQFPESDDKKLSNKWQLPTTDVLENESHEEALQRLMKEDFGIKGQIGVLQKKHIYFNNDEKIELFIYRSKLLSGKPIVKDHYKALRMFRVIDVEKGNYVVPYDRLMMGSIFYFMIHLKSETGGY